MATPTPANAKLSINRCPLQVITDSVRLATAKAILATEKAFAVVRVRLLSVGVQDPARHLGKTVAYFTDCEGQKFPCGV